VTLAQEHSGVELRTLGEVVYTRPTFDDFFRGDKSSKWLIEHHGDSILRMAGVRDFTAWKTASPRASPVSGLPDGVIEVRSPGEAEPDVCILEIATYPDARVPSQAVRGRTLVYRQSWIVPEVICVSP
jgi:hypothetical protein